MHNSHPLQKKISPAVVFSASIVVAAYWLIGNLLNIYNSKLAGIVFEILWLPMLLLLFAIPAIALFYWIKSRFKFTSLYFFSLAVSLTVLIVLITKNN